mmetsp:Transcript_2099/g.7600  ORF Transcript_2099/g.7600 Transcript_2099/m.7600 type:complete len:85 (-) Transcript_2099:2093-2347(-)
MSRFKIIVGTDLVKSEINLQMSVQADSSRPPKNRAKKMENLCSTGKTSHLLESIYKMVMVPFEKPMHVCRSRIAHYHTFGALSS